ncbi:YhgE/Pip domain-containing protein [Xylanimonas protaetiae]|uniref:YhgE/Pip domain-containing protein n=1 Tax=Xylanimonas protaetiae TaxID=2509457 RepID=A0A4P6F603_9MICO|nr:YhgE/Pip domain-containing protein [Xylanimonas protaetiae]QAY71162.1 YhgE/Pip domain-containing protein [Xylanimonas protaetiae]
MTALRLALSELRRLSSGTLPKAALAAIALIPTLYAGLYLFANHDPYGNLGQVPAAVVVQDAGPHGREVADHLLDDGGFGWQEVADAATADQGVRDGRYDAALVLGPTFSADLESAGRLEPQQASMTLVTDDTNSYLARTIAAQVVDKVRDTLATQVGTQAADTFLAGFADVHAQLTRAADGAARLADGTTRLAAGVGQAGDGAHQAASGASRLADGAAQLAAGAVTAAGGSRDLATGASQAADGAAALAAGLGTLRDGTAALPDQARALADGAAQVAAGDATVAGYGDQVRDVAGRALPALDQVRTDVQARLDAAVAAGTITADQAAALESTLTPVLDAGRAKVSDVVAQVGDATGQLDALAAGAQQVADGAAALADAAPALADGVRQAADGAATLAGGTAQVRDGARSLADGVGTLATGATTLADGSATLRTGTTALADGTDALRAGAGQAADGSAALRDGLTDGAAQVPNPDDATRAATAETIGDPVAVVAAAHDAAGTYGAGLAPFFLSLAGWIGAYVMFLIVRPLSRRALAAGRGVAAAVGGWLVPAAIGVVQAAAMFSVTRWALHIDVAHGLGTALFLALVSVTFVAIVQLLNVWLGAAGQFLGLVLMLVQLVTAGGTFPWQTIPEPLRSVHRYLPMSWSVDGLRHLLYGGSLSTVGRDAGLLLVVLVAALAGTSLLARRQRVWTAARLQPELVL